MKKPVIIAAGSLTVIAVAVGTTCFIGKTNMEKRSLAFEETIKKLNAELPPSVKVENKIERGLFSSEGVYKVTHNNAEKTNSLTFKYTLEHGVDAWFGGDIKVKGTGHLEGYAAKALKIKTADNVLYTLTGNLKEDGSMTFNQSSAEMTLSMEDEKNPEKNGTVKIAPSTAVAVYTKSSGELKTSFKYPKVSITEKNNSFFMTGLEGNYDFNVNQPEVGRLQMKMASLNDSKDRFSAKGLELLISSEKKNNKYDVKFMTKAQNVNFMNQKDTEFEFGYSILGLDTKLMQLYRDFYKNMDKKDAEPNDKQVKEAFLATAQTGFVFSIDKIKYKNAANVIDLSGKYEIAPSKTEEEFSVEEKTKFSFKLDAQGELAQLAQMTLGPMVGLNTEMSEEGKPVAPVTKFNLSFIYDNFVLKINDKEVEPKISISIRKTFREIDHKLGIVKDLPPLDEEDIEDTEVPEEEVTIPHKK